MGRHKKDKWDANEDLDRVIDISHMEKAQREAHMKALDRRSTCPCGRCKQHDSCNHPETCDKYRRWRKAYLNSCR